MRSLWWLSLVSLCIAGCNVRDAEKKAVPAPKDEEVKEQDFSRSGSADFLGADAAKLGESLGTHPATSPFPETKVGVTSGEPRASVNPPDANQQDIELILPEPTREILVTHTAFEALAMGNGLSLAGSPTFEIDHLDFDRTVSARVLPGFLAKLKAAKQLPIPVLLRVQPGYVHPLEGFDRNYFRAQNVCIADKNDKCVRDLSHRLAGRITAKGEKLSLASFLNYETDLEPASGESLKIEFVHLKAQGRSPEISWTNPVNGLFGASKPSLLFHPGNNPYVKQALDLGFAKYKSLAPTGSVIDFVTRFRLANCQFTSMAVAQLHQRNQVAESATNPAWAPSNYFVVSGALHANSQSRVVDITTRNHMWNAATQAGRFSSIQFSDSTPIVNPRLEYVFNAGTLKWFQNRLAKATKVNELDTVTAVKNVKGVTVPLVGETFLETLEPKSSLLTNPKGGLAKVQATLDQNKSELVTKAGLTPSKKFDRWYQHPTKKFYVQIFQTVGVYNPSPIGSIAYAPTQLWGAYLPGQDTWDTRDSSYHDAWANTAKDNGWATWAGMNVDPAFSDDKLRARTMKFREVYVTQTWPSTMTKEEAKKILPDFFKRFPNKHAERIMKEVETASQPFGDCHHPEWGSWVKFSEGRFHLCKGAWEKEQGYDARTTDSKVRAYWQKRGHEVEPMYQWEIEYLIHN